jgi:ABC-type antimicrobial peptide transport system permease subunit
MDLLELYQIRLDKCAAEQFWAVALLASMNGFIIIKKQILKEALGEIIPQLGIVVATLMGIGYIVSRHFIYLRYDLLANQILLQKAGNLSLLMPPSDGFMKDAALWSGVVFYSIIVIVMGIVSFKVSSKPRENEGEEA